MSATRPDGRRLEDPGRGRIVATHHHPPATPGPVTARTSLPGPSLAGTVPGAAPDWLRRAKAEPAGPVRATPSDASSWTPGPALPPDPPTPRVVSVAAMLAASRETAARGRHLSPGRRRADTLPARAIAAAAGVAATLGLIAVLVPPEALVATSVTAAADIPSPDPVAADAAGQLGAAASPSDVTETPAPVPTPLASPAATSKAKATTKATSSAAAKSSVTQARAAATAATSGATPKPTAKASAKPAAPATAAPAAAPTAKRTPAPTVAPAPQPVPVTTSASGKP